MDNSEKLDILNSILESVESINSRKELIELRANHYYDNTLIKVAVDTRRVKKNQIHPRKALKNFNRSEPFISEGLSKKIKNLNILKEVLEEIRKEYETFPEWDDSNCRILNDYLNTALRKDINDKDFSENQKGVGAFNYLDELLYSRYRLQFSDLDKFDKKDLKKMILSKDEDLINKDILPKNDLNIKKSDISNMSYDQLINVLFSGVKASVENKKVKRKITIEVEDEILE